MTGTLGCFTLLQYMDYNFSYIKINVCQKELHYDWMLCTQLTWRSHNHDLQLISARERNPLVGVDWSFIVTFFTALTTFSGINDYDYPSLSSPSVGLAGMELVSLLKRVPLPAELVEQFNCILWVLLLFVINEVMWELQLCKQVHWTVCGLEFIYYKQSKTIYFD